MNKKSWTKKYQLILWLITLLVIICTLCYHILDLGKTLMPHTSNKESNFTQLDYENESISEISINMPAADLELISGDTLAVSHNFSTKYEPEITIKNGKLTIEQKNRVRINNLEDFSIKIIVPASSKLDTLSIDLDAGDIDIKSLEIENIDIEVDAGDIDIEDINSLKTEISSDAGDIDIENSSLGALELDINAGDIKLDNILFTDGDISADAGSIQIDGTFEKLEASCSMGNIEVTTPDPTTADIELDCSLGTATVNGKRW